MTAQRIDLNKLLVFRAIVLSGNMTKAAAQLRLPKSRVSRQLASLEEEIGVQLIFRTTRSLQLTPAGKKLADEALLHLVSLETSIERISSGEEEIGGKIRISVPDDVGVQLMSGICHSFMAMYPQVVLDVHVGNQKVDLVKDAFDLALRVGKLHDSTMIRKNLGEFHVSFYLSPEALARYGYVVGPEDLGKVPFLAFQAGDVKYQLHRRNEKKTIVLKPIFRSNNFFVLRDMAIRGAGLASLPTFLGDEAVASGKLVPVAADWRPQGYPVQLIMPQQKIVPPRVSKLAKHVQNQMAPFLTR